MRVLVQRAAQAAVTVDGQTVATTGRGLLLLVGFSTADAADPQGAEADMAWMVGKLLRLRVFPDADGVMNLSLLDAGGELLAVSQFTLFASTRKGNRPSWSGAAGPEAAGLLFARFVTLLRQESGLPVPTGIFGADMQVALVNDGPVTLLLDSRAPE